MAGDIGELMTDPEPGAGDFPVADCGACSRVVLAHLWMADGGEESHRCIHCDAVLADVRWVDEGELGEIGYAEITQDAGCGRPDCGRGRCGPPEPR
jgi:hypothetical protein